MGIRDFSAVSVEFQQRGFPEFSNAFYRSNCHYYMYAIQWCFRFFKCFGLWEKF